MDSSNNPPFDVENFTAKLLAAVQNDIEPLLPADQYPKSNLLTSLRDGSFLWGLGREKYLAKYGHVLLSRECVDALKRVIGERSVLDVCAGGGYLAHVLANEGVDIKAVDLHPPGPQPSERDPRHLWKIDFACSALDLPLRDYGVLLLVWPDHGHPFADQVAAAMDVGQMLIYQGEPPGAATASDEFFERISGEGWHFLGPFTDALNKDHVWFHGMKDRWYVFQKGPGAPE